MEIDSATKGNGKGKEKSESANSTETNKQSKYCLVCEKSSHTNQSLERIYSLENLWRFSQGVDVNTCAHGLKRNKLILIGDDTLNAVFNLPVCNMEVIENKAQNVNTTFTIPVILWVYGKKTQVEELIDSETMPSFINKDFVKNNSLVTHKTTMPYDIHNYTSVKHSCVANY